MPCTRSGWQSNRSNSVFRNYTEQTNCLNGSLEASSPETDDPLSMTAAIPSNPDPHEEERARESKMLRPWLTAYSAKLFTNATITTHDHRDGHTETRIKSELPPEKDRAYIIAEYDQYGKVKEAHFLKRDPSNSQNQPQFTLIDKDDYPQMIQDSRDATNRRELHVIVKPQWVDDPKRDKSIEVYNCDWVAEADLLNRITVPDHLIPDSSSILNPG
jgi:hypothetical protein